MVVKNVIIAVDEKFFKNVFEKQRIQLQKKLGIINLSQPKFTKMISEMKIRPLKKDVLDFKPKRGRKKDEFLMF